MSSYHYQRAVISDTPIFTEASTFSYLNIVSEVVGHNSLKYVKRDVSASMTHVRVIIDSRAASVPCDFIWVHWCEQVFLSCESVQHAKFWLLVAFYIKVQKKLEVLVISSKAIVSFNISQSFD